MFTAALKALKSSVLVACFLIAQVRTASTEETTPLHPPPRGTAISTRAVKEIREAATRAVRLIDRSSPSSLPIRACFPCHTQTLSAMVLRDARKVGLEV